MEKQELIKLMESVIYGHKHLTIETTGDGSFRLYDSTDSFTGTFISNVIGITGDNFTGLSVDSDGRPYMLFNY